MTWNVMLVEILSLVVYDRALKELFLGLGYFTYVQH